MRGKDKPFQLAEDEDERERKGEREKSASDLRRYGTWRSSSSCCCCSFSLSLFFFFSLLLSFSFWRDSRKKIRPLEAPVGEQLKEVTCILVIGFPSCYIIDLFHVNENDTLTSLLSLSLSLPQSSLLPSLSFLVFGCNSPSTTSM